MLHVQVNGNKIVLNASMIINKRYSLQLIRKACLFNIIISQKSITFPISIKSINIVIALSL